MPFAKRIVEPSRVRATCSRSNDTRKGETPHVVIDRELTINTFSNRALVTALRQLSSLAKQADDICAELTDECQSVSRRTGKLFSRVSDLSQAISALDSRTVTIPVSSLVDSSQVTDHLHTDYVQDTGQFSIDSRPGCVRSLYDQADLSPVEVIRSCDRYRTDGRSGSELFLVSPVILQEDRQSPDLGTSHKVILVGDEFLRKPKELPEPKPRPHSFPSVLTELDIDTNNRQRALPTPEEKLHTMSKSQPASLVPIDVSGMSFERLCEYRVSLRNVQQPEYGSVDRRSMSKKRSRRKTVSGVPGVAFDEVNVSVPCLFGTNISSGDRWPRQRPCSIAFDHYAPRAASHQVLHHGSGKSMEEPERPPLKRSNSFRKSLRSLFRSSRSKSTTLWVEERPRSPGPPVVNLNMAPPVRRSRSVSLTKSLRSVRESFHKFINSRSVSTDRAHKVERGSTTGQVGEVKGQPEPEKIKKPSRIQRIGKKLGIFRSQQRKQGGNESPMTRSRSMDMSTVNAVNQKPVHAGMPAFRSTMALVENRVTVPPDQSWIHRFADVKLRDNLQLAKHHENRQSSSGNWSGSTDSARQSLTSDCAQHAFATVPECSSEASLDKDSAVSLTIHSPNSDRLYTGAIPTYTAGDDMSTFTGGTTVNTDSETGVMKTNFTKMSTEEWLKNLNMKRNSCTKLTNHSATDRQVLTQQNLIAHEQSLNTSKLVRAEDDGGSSVYSVDQDGYYTSMHKDSGLGRSGQCSNGNHMSSSTFTPTSAHCIVKSKKNPFFMTNNLRGKTGSQGNRGKVKKTPPPPPPRVSTNQGSVNGDNGVRSLRQDDSRVEESASTHSRVMSADSCNVEEDYARGPEHHSRVSQTGLKSIMSAPGCLSNYAPRSGISTIGGAKMDCIAEVSNESSADQSYSSVDDCILPRYQHRQDNDTNDGYSTWPRSPRTVVVATKNQAEGILKNGTSVKHRHPQTLNFAPMVNIFDETNTPSATFCGIQQAQTPDDFLAEKRGFPLTENMFQDMQSNAKAMRYGMPLSRETTGGKYQHCMALSPRTHQKKDCHEKQNTLTKNPLLHRAPSFQSQTDMTQKDCNDGDYTSTWPRLRRSVNRDASGTTLPVPQKLTEPVAAPARLIISSPMAGRAEFVENRHKRVLCSPVTTEDLIAFSTCTSPKCQRVPAMKPAVPQTTASHLYHTAPPEGIFDDPSPTVNEMPSSLPFTQCSAFKPVSVPLFPSLSAMKHSIPFPIPDPEKPVARTAVTRSWYDGMHTKVYENPLGEHNEVLRTSLLKDSADGGVTMRPRRDSNSSTMSTHSSSSSRRSVTFATVHRSSSSNLVTKLDRAISSSLLCVPEQVTCIGVKRSRSMCSSSSGSESSWRHKYAPSSLLTGVAPPVVPTFTTFTKPEPKAKRICVDMETHKMEVDQPIVTQAYQFQVAPANMSFTGFTNLQQTSLSGHTQTFGNQKIKPKVPQRDSSFKETKLQQSTHEDCVFAVPQDSSGQPTRENFTPTGNTFVRSYAPPMFVVPKQDLSSRSVTDMTSCCRDTTSGQSSCSDSAVNIPYVNGKVTNGHPEENRGSLKENGNCMPMENITRCEISVGQSIKVAQMTYSARLALLSKTVTDAQSGDRRFSEHLSASCSSLARDHGKCRSAKDTAVLDNSRDHVSSMQGLCQDKMDTGVTIGGDIKGDSQSGKLVSPAVSSLSSSGLGSSVASSPDSRPNSPDLTDMPPTGEDVKHSAAVSCKT